MCLLIMSEAFSQRCSVKKMFLETSQNSQENTCSSGLQLYFKKKTLAQVFSCEFCEVSKNTYSYRTPLVAASVMLKVNTEIMST